VNAMSDINGLQEHVTGIDQNVVAIMRHLGV
jgi:hypothetical protein